MHTFSPDVARSDVIKGRWSSGVMFVDRRRFRLRLYGLDLIDTTVTVYARVAWPEPSTLYYEIHGTTMAARIANGTQRIATLGPIYQALDQIVSNLVAVAEKKEIDENWETTNFECSFDLSLHFEGDYYIPHPLGGVIKGRIGITSPLGRKGFTFRHSHPKGAEVSPLHSHETVRFDLMDSPATDSNVVEYEIEGEKVDFDTVRSICRDPGGWQSSGLKEV